MAQTATACDLPPLYHAYVNGWDPRSSCKQKLKMSFLLPHEILDHFVQPGNHHEWSDLGDRPGLQQTLMEWGERLDIPVMQERFLSLGVWGDAAPYAHRDSLYLMVFNVISGKHHKRFWFASCPKR